MRLLFALFFAFTLLGCRLVGTTDVELTYEATTAPTTAKFGEDVRALVMRRLSAAQIGADVDQSENTVKIVVDEAVAPVVDDLVRWAGTLQFYDAEYNYVPTPTDLFGLAAKEERRPDGVIERYWEGPRSAVLRAVEQWTIDKSFLLLGEAEWSDREDDPIWRTRIVKAQSFGELGDGILVGRGEGGTLRLRAKPGSLAQATIDDAKERPLAPFLVRGRISLGAPMLQKDAALLSFGGGIRSYSRAQQERLLLVTPRLPAMRRVGVVGLPPNNVLAAACFVVPLILSLAWLLFVRRFDRAHPEPIWLVLATFALGAFATIPASFLEVLLSKLTPWLDPRVVTFGGQVFAFPLALVVFTVVVGFVEEGTKFLGASFAARRREFDEPIDGIVYGIASSLGFAAAENFHYFALTRLSPTIVVARCFMSVPAHMFFGAIWGYALGARLVDRRLRVIVWLGFSALAHGLFDALLATDGGALFAVGFDVALASVFVILVRRALRHGIVEEASIAIRPEERRLYRVGRNGLFWVSSIALHLLALAIFFLGAFHQLSRHSPGHVFVIGSSVLLALLAVAAFGISAAVPLDVAIDDYGVTFCGAARPWRRIRGFTIHGDHVLLDCEGGSITLGPAPAEMVSEIASAIRDHLGDQKNRQITLQSG